MRKLPWVVLASAGVIAACSDRPPVAPGGSLPRGTWASDVTSLTIQDTSAILKVATSAACYGSYGEVDQPIPAPTFDVPGTYHQLTGAYPGQITYAARLSGAVQGQHLSITITVPALQQAYGPYGLTFGLNQTWNACLYP